MTQHWMFIISAYVRGGDLLTRVLEARPLVVIIDNDKEKRDRMQRRVFGGTAALSAALR